LGDINKWTYINYFLSQEDKCLGNKMLHQGYSEIVFADWRGFFLTYGCLGRYVHVPFMRKNVCLFLNKNIITLSS
jgi:hypothetical protein